MANKYVCLALQPGVALASNVMWDGAAGSIWRYALFSISAILYLAATMAPVANSYNGY